MLLPNLARMGTPEDHPEVNIRVRTELLYADIEFMDIEDCPKGEVPHTFIAGLLGWKFTRAWRYWIAKGPGIPPNIAHEFNKEWGRVCRIDGHCGCPDPDYKNGFAVDMYHIDTIEGLKAFADLLRSISSSCNTDGFGGPRKC